MEGDKKFIFSCEILEDYVMTPILRIILFIADAKLVYNKIAKTFLDLSVTWNGRLPPIFGIHVDVVPSAMPFHMTAGFQQFANEVNPLQISTPISF